MVCLGLHQRLHRPLVSLLAFFPLVINVCPLPPQSCFIAFFISCVIIFELVPLMPFFLLIIWIIRFRRTSICSFYFGISSSHGLWSFPVISFITVEVVFLILILSWVYFTITSIFTKHLVGSLHSVLIYILRLLVESSPGLRDFLCIGLSFVCCCFVPIHVLLAFFVNWWPIGFAFFSFLVLLILLVLSMIHLIVWIVWNLCCFRCTFPNVYSLH